MTAACGAGRTCCEHGCRNPACSPSGPYSHGRRGGCQGEVAAAPCPAEAVEAERPQTKAAGRYGCAAGAGGSGRNSSFRSGAAANHVGRGALQVEGPRLAERRSSRMQPRRRASMISGRPGPGPCQARCRLSTGGSRAPGPARGAAARQATPPGPRSLPGNPAAEQSGRQLLPRMSSCRWPRVGSAAVACSQSGRSTQPRLAGSSARRRSSAVPGSPGRRAKPA